VNTWSLLPYQCTLHERKSTNFSWGYNFEKGYKQDIDAPPQPQQQPPSLPQQPQPLHPEL
jgi:hypothetical protein